MVDTLRCLRFAEHLIDDPNSVGMLDENTFTDEEWRLVFRYAAYFEGYREAKRRQGNRRAYVMLRSLLAPEQRDQLRKDRKFIETAPSGTAYRLIPATGTTQRVERHGSRWYFTGMFCLHPDHDLRIPNADTTIGHLLMIRYDEDAFLREANLTERRHGGWNGEWRRRLNAARREREAAA